MNSVAHCGGFYLRDIVEEKCRFRPACRKLSGLSREKTRITPRLSQTSGAQQRKNTDYAPLVGNFRGSTEEKHELRPACRKLPGLNREKTRITPRLSEASGAQQRKNTNYAPLVANFRGSTEKKHGLRPACRKLPGLNREKTWITPRLSQTSGAQQRKNVDYRAFRNVGYNKCRDAHRGKMFRLLWTFVDLKLPSAMSHAIHKIVSKERCQSYFISRRSPHLGISKDSELCERPSLSSLCLCAAHCSHNFLVISGPGADFPALHPVHTASPSRFRGRSLACWRRGSRSRR